MKLIVFKNKTGDLKKGELGWAALAGKTNEFKQSLEKAIEYAKKLDCKRYEVYR